MKQLYILVGISMVALGYLLYRELKSLEDTQSYILDELSELKNASSGHLETYNVDDSDEEDEQPIETKTDMCQSTCSLGSSFVKLETIDEQEDTTPQLEEEHMPQIELLEDSKDEESKLEEESDEYSDDMILNPSTGRYVKKSGKVGKKLLQEQLEADAEQHLEELSQLK